jgi:predicted amidohydrolase YtcJ
VLVARTAAAPAVLEPEAGLSYKTFMHDLILSGGRVIEPETGHDAIADVAVSAGKVVAIGTSLGAARAAGRAT